MLTESPYLTANLQRSAWHFLTGRLASAVLTFFILLWVVRLLPLAEYGLYITLVAGMELMIGISGLGLPWISARYLPEYRLHAPGSCTQKLVSTLLIGMIVSLTVFTGFLGIALSHYLPYWPNLDAYREAVMLYLFVLLLEGFGRLVIVSLLEPLMQQRIVRSSMIFRQLTFIVLLFLLTSSDSGQLINVIHAELVASILGAAMGLGGLWRHLSSFTAYPGKPDWCNLKIQEMFRVGYQMYFSYLITMLYGAQIFQLIILHVLGLEAAAAFGFLRTLQDKIARFLPASLLISLIRPKLVAGYINGGGIDELRKNTNLAGKFSIFVLMPMVAIVASNGDLLVPLLSGGKFIGSGGLLLGFILVLIPFSQRQLVESIAVITGHASLCTHAAAIGLITLPLMWFMLQAELELWAGIIAMGLGHLLFHIIVNVGVFGANNYRPDWVGFLKLLISSIVACGVSMLPGFLGIGTGASPWLLIALQCILALIVYLTVAWWVKPFSSSERNRINILLKHQVFIW